jgi:hypothetical protein
MDILDLIEKYNGAITAIATFFVAIFTGVLYRATNKQAKLTRASIDLARSEYVSTHRPRLKIREITPELRDGEPINIHCTVTNIGETPARVDGHWIKLWVILPSYDNSTPRESHESSIDLLASDLAGGQSEIFLTQRATTFNYSEAWKINEPFGASMYIEGGFIYRDDIGVPRRMGFSRQYYIATKRFDFVNEGDGEYQD